ncbi:MAG: hypothetical protein M3Z21_11630 [Pseudomonadota bacterium]|nr:hypothetical protein [Pseudomonadota bacterium]
MTGLSGRKYFGGTVGLMIYWHPQDGHIRCEIHTRRSRQRAECLLSPDGTPCRFTLNPDTGHDVSGTLWLAADGSATVLMGRLDLGRDGRFEGVIGRWSGDRPP